MSIGATPTQAPSQAQISGDARRGASSPSVHLAITTGRGLTIPRIVALCVVAIALVAYSLSGGGYEARYALAISGCYGLAVLGVNVIGGTARDINLAAGAQMAIGAYSFAYGQTHGWPLILSVIFALAMAAALSFVIALGVVRLRGIYTALATFALAFCIPDAATYFGGFTGGGSGKYALPVVIGGIKLGGADQTFVIVVVALFAIVGVGWLIYLSSVAGGRSFLLEEAEPALLAFGRSVYWRKVRIWTLAGVIAGLGGILFSLAVGYLTPQEFTYSLSLQLFVGGVVGGVTSVVGGLLGGLLVGAIPVYLGSASGGSEDIIFGALLLASILIGRGGVWPRVEQLACDGWSLLRRNA